MYMIGALIDQARFPIATPNDLKSINPSMVRDKFLSVFPGDSLGIRLSNLITSPEYKQWSDVRNILTHRAQPSRIHHVVFGAQHQSSSPIEKTELKLAGLELNSQTTAARRGWLVKELTECIDATHQFVRAYFP